MMDVYTEQGLKDAQEWLNNLLNNIKDGGTWAIPRSGAIYTFYHSKKLATRSNGIDEPTEVVLKSLGWSIKCL